MGVEEGQARVEPRLNDLLAVVTRRGVSGQVSLDEIVDGS